MKKILLASIILILFSNCQSNYKKKMIEPSAKKIPTILNYHSDSLTDNYFCETLGISILTLEQLAAEELYDIEGDPRAAYSLGEFYDDHPLIISNYKKAARLYLYAAERGVPEAQYNIANMYERGDGVRKDLVQSVRWYLQCNVSSLCKAGQEGIDDLINQLSYDEFEYAKSLIDYSMKEIDIRITVGR